MSDLQINGVPAQQAAGFTPLYLSNGLVPPGTKSKKFLGTVTSKTDGTWSLDISAAGFPNVAIVAGIAPVSADGTAQSTFFAQVTSTTTTLVQGTVMQPSLSVLGVLSVALSNKACTFNVLVIGW